MCYVIFRLESDNTAPFTNGKIMMISVQKKTLAFRTLCNLNKMYEPFSARPLIFNIFSPLDGHLFIVPSDLPTDDEEWVRLLQRQAALHQIEIERWHDLLSTASSFLRQVRHILTKKKVT